MLRTGNCLSEWDLLEGKGMSVIVASWFLWHNVSISIILFSRFILKTPSASAEGAKFLAILTAAKIHFFWPVSLRPTLLFQLKVYQYLFPIFLEHIYYSSIVNTYRWHILRVKILYFYHFAISMYFEVHIFAAH